MSLIDQRILIVAPVDTVWTYVSDPVTMTKWNKNCKQISVLTTKSTGVGTRRRCIDANGRAEVLETTAYFENIGYEYRVVDGPYREFRGRFRLQAVPEGTIVNWTVEYRLRGLLAGLRNFLIFRRHFEDMMAESLRSLRRLVEASGVRLEPDSHARYAMQDGPGVEARAARSPEATRPAAHKAKPGALKGVAVGEDDVPELPASSDIAGPTVVRVPPRPPETPSATPSVAPSVRAEPDRPVGEAPAASTREADLEDTKPRAPKGLREALAAEQARAASQPAPSAEDLESEQTSLDKALSAPTVPISMVAPPPEPPQETQTIGFTPPPPPWPGVPDTSAVPDTLPERVPTSLPSRAEPPVHESKPAEPPGPVEEPSLPKEQEAPKPAPTDKLDTGEVSIWEVFGLERPSERVQAELEGLIASITPRPKDGHYKHRGTDAGNQGPRLKAEPRVRPVRSKREPRQKTTVRARRPVRRK